MIRWEAWCYRCRGRDTGVEADEHTAGGRISDFRRDHQGSCGAGTSIGHSIAHETVALTGDGSPREGETGA